MVLCGKSNILLYTWMLFVIKGLSKGTLKGITAAGESISQSFIKNTQDLKIKILLFFFHFSGFFFSYI